jgi:hypothetical protein
MTLRGGDHADLRMSLGRSRGHRPTCFSAVGIGYAGDEQTQRESVSYDRKYHTRTTPAWAWIHAVMVERAGHMSRVGTRFSYWLSKWGQSYPAGCGTPSRWWLSVGSALLRP